MPQAIDIKLTQGADGVWDIGLDENGDLEKDYSFGTTIALSIIGRRRATAAEVATPENRGGWIGNILADVAGFEAGSKGWLLRQSRMRSNTHASMKNYHQEALEWMKEDGLAKEIIIVSQQNLSGINEEINIDGESFYFDVWNNTRL
jgi:phage gp46-like protein